MAAYIEVKRIDKSSSACPKGGRGSLNIGVATTLAIFSGLKKLLIQYRGWPLNRVSTVMSPVLVRYSA